MDTSAQSDSRAKKQNAWNSFLYDGFQNLQDPLVLRQAFFINTFAVLGFIAVFTFGTFHFLDKNYHVAIPEILGGITFLLTIIYLRISKNIIVSKLILLATQGVLLVVMLATGGTANTGIFWFFTYPITVFFLMGRNKGLIWVAFLYIVTLLLYILSTFGMVAIAYSFIEIRQLLASLLITTSLIYLYQSSIEKSERGIKERTDQLEIAKRTIEQEKVTDEALLASLGEGMVTIGSSGKILTMNHAAEKMFHITGASAVGKDIQTLFSLKNDNGVVLVNDQRPWFFATKGEKKTGEYTCTLSDGFVFSVAIIATPLVLNGKTIGAIELFRDTTEEKKLDQAKSEFIALASHQLRTPISGISWFTEMLLNGDSGPLTEEQKEYLTKVYQSNERMGELVTSLLYVSQIELGKVVIKPEPLNLSNLSHTVLQEELKKYQGEKKLIITEHFDQQQPLLLLDKEIIQLVLQHLFSNAIKYNRDNGRIELTISSGQSDTKSVKNKDDGILIRIMDSGIGIPKYQSDKIFLKLFRGDNARNVETDGTGIGLYIVKTVIEEIGGRVWFTSEENKGSTFFVWLPTKV